MNWRRSWSELVTSPGSPRLPAFHGS